MANMEVTRMRMSTVFSTGTSEPMMALVMMRSDVNLRKRRTARKTRRRRRVEMTGRPSAESAMMESATTKKSNTFHASIQ